MRTASVATSISLAYAPADFALSFVAVAVVARLVTVVGNVAGVVETRVRTGVGEDGESRARRRRLRRLRETRRRRRVSAPSSGEHAPVRLLDLWPTLGRTEGRANCAEAAIAGVADGNGDGADERGARGMAADSKGISKICALFWII
jgi:hypothetical protein